MTTWDDVAASMRGLTREQVRTAVNRLPPEAVAALLAEKQAEAYTAPLDPLALGAELYDNFIPRPHLALLSDKIRDAVFEVEKGRSQRLLVELPPRTGKTTMTTLTAPAWIMSRHPEWPIALTSHDGGLATSWGRQIRRWVDSGRLGNIETARDAGAASSWETTAGGKLLSISLRESFTGRGAKVLVVDDPHKDFQDATSEKVRQNIWDWWLSVALTRLEAPSLVIVTMTRWHEDDFIGRLLSPEREGDPSEWQVLRLPAIAEQGDAMGREVGEPLLTPLVDETAEEAVVRYSSVKESVGSYVWNAMYQQRPAPMQGAVFNVGWLRYWTTDPSLATEDGRIRLVDFRAMVGARWLDSWDMAFKATDHSDYVVGQRWCRHGANRFLVDQVRGRWSFTTTLAEMLAFASGGRFPEKVHQRLVEDKANGTAVMDTLHDRIAGLKPVNPQGSKEARATAVTPEVESGNVYLPHVSEAPWVLDFISEVRSFPTGAHDDQVDTMSQALFELREQGSTHITQPADRLPAGVPMATSRTLSAARTEIRRSRGG
jgi:predicted phage terminase large subunit-like protein